MTRGENKIPVTYIWGNKSETSRLPSKARSADILLHTFGDHQPNSYWKNHQLVLQMFQLWPPDGAVDELPFRTIARNSNCFEDRYFFSISEGSVNINFQQKWLHCSTFSQLLLRSWNNYRHWTFSSRWVQLLRGLGRWTFQSGACVCVCVSSGCHGAVLYLFTWHQLVNSTMGFRTKMTRKIVDKPVSIKSLAVKRKSSSHSLWQYLSPASDKWGRMKANSGVWFSENQDLINMCDRAS